MQPLWPLWYSLASLCLSLSRYASNEEHKAAGQLRSAQSQRRTLAKERSSSPPRPRDSSTVTAPAQTVQDDPEFYSQILHDSPLFP